MGVSSFSDVGFLHVLLWLTFLLINKPLVYAWGDTWEQAKAQCESFDYLFETAVKLKSMGIDCGVKPCKGTYREDESVTSSVASVDEEEKKVEPPAKKQKVTGPAPAFNAAGATDNDADLALTRTTIPLVPRDAKILLLDIEGTTTSISFVHDVLFPYVRNNLKSYVLKLSNGDVAKHLRAIKKDLKALDNNHPSVLACKDTGEKAPTDSLTLHVIALMDHDVKATGLKALQSDMWEAGYNSGELMGHIYSDFKLMLSWCEENRVSVCIYSSGAIAAQKLLFGNTESWGDLTRYFDNYFDTTTGNKKESASYARIASELAAKPKDIVFVSDSEAEVNAAREAGMISVVAVRPGNAPLSEETKRDFPIVRSLLQLCGAD
jgi:2,3-diketo-5-methylthio-1-phosphopentane phosphatase